MVSTYHRLRRWRPIRAMLAVGRVAHAGWRRAMGVTCPFPNPRNEVHYDKDFQESDLILAPAGRKERDREVQSLSYIGRPLSSGQPDRRSLDQYGPQAWRFPRASGDGVLS